MAKNHFERYIWLINLIHRRGHIKFEEISRAWAFSPLNSASIQQSELPQRTFFNHIEAISATFGIEIKCDRSKGYYIANSDDLAASRRHFGCRLPDHQLQTAAAACGFGLTNHHHALADADACAHIAMRIL